MRTHLSKPEASSYITTGGVVITISKRMPSHLVIGLEGAGRLAITCFLSLPEQFLRVGNTWAVFEAPLITRSGDEGMSSAFQGQISTTIVGACNIENRKEKEGNQKV